MMSNLEAQNGTRHEPNSSNSMSETMKSLSCDDDETGDPHNKYIRISRKRCTSYEIFSDRLYKYVLDDKDSCYLDAQSRQRSENSASVQAAGSHSRTPNLQIDAATKEATEIVPANKERPVSKSNEDPPAPSDMSISETPEINQDFASSGCRSTSDIGVIDNCATPKNTSSRNSEPEEGIVGPSIEQISASEHMLPVPLEASEDIPEASKDTREASEGITEASENSPEVSRDTPETIQGTAQKVQNSAITEEYSNDHLSLQIVSCYSLRHSEFDCIQDSNVDSSVVDSVSRNIDCASPTKRNEFNEEKMDCDSITDGGNATVQQQTRPAREEEVLLDCCPVLHGTKMEQLKRLQFSNETMVNVWNFLCETLPNPPTRIRRHLREHNYATD